MLILFIALCVVPILAAGLATYCYGSCRFTFEATIRKCEEATEELQLARRNKREADATLAATNQLYIEMCGMVNSVHKVRDELVKPAPCYRKVTDRDLAYLKSIVETPHRFSPVGSPVSPVTPIYGDRQHEVLASVEADFGSSSPEVTAESDPVLHKELMEALFSGDSMTSALPKHDAFGIRPLPNGVQS